MIKRQNLLRASKEMTNTCGRQPHEIGSCNVLRTIFYMACIKS